MPAHRTSLTMEIIAGHRIPLLDHPMYETVIHTPRWGGGDDIIAAGSLISCLKKKAEFDYHIRQDAFSFSWVQRWDGKIVSVPPGVISRMAYE